MERTDNPEVLAIVPLPSQEERRRREVMPGDGLESSRPPLALDCRRDPIVA